MPDQRLFGVETARETVQPVLVSAARPWLVAIDGIGGIGKTSLAHDLIHRLLDMERFHNIGWVSAEQEVFLPENGLQSTGRPALYTYIYWQAWHMLDETSRQLFLTMPLCPNCPYDELQTASGLPTEAIQPALAQLTALSLVEVGGNLADPHYRLHRLTETFLLNEVVKWQATE